MTYVLIVSVLVCAGQLCQKQAVEGWRDRAIPLSIKLRSPWLWAALVFLGLGMMIWLLALRVLPVGVAYPMLSLNFVWVTLAARFLFNEPVGWQHGAGIALIIAGISCLAPAL
ncbi:4-amino-4-deoxy-L-arabinose-phosphoundecaprenol flippase subunit ArnE [Salinisphaera sp. RV14]|uniref:4-amino-4-deoxy-L-arabinose-phosphoundecaprenol flippase subunit ArnE n=1 Tax=unclassified Salinisphaera TaxID=2649847 RepID=UPI003F8694F0